MFWAAVSLSSGRNQKNLIFQHQITSAFCKKRWGNFQPRNFKHHGKITSAHYLPGRMLTYAKLPFRCKSSLKSPKPGKSNNDEIFFVLITSAYFNLSQIAVLALPFTFSWPYVGIHQITFYLFLSVMCKSLLITKLKSPKHKQTIKQ